MGWTLASLFVVSALLLIASILKSIQASKVEQKRIDMAHISVMKDINEMQESIRNIELDIEVVKNDAGIKLTSDEITFMREILDLYKRNYSIQSIAAKKQVPESEIKQLLAPYKTIKVERGKVANEN